MLRGEYVRSRQQVKALGMEEVSVGDPAATRGELMAPRTGTEGRRGFEPFVEERDDRVATPESLGASLRVWLRHNEFDDVASSGCERDSGADGASASSSPWIGATESDPGVGERGIVPSEREV